MKTNCHSFSLINNTTKRKHCSCLTFYETYETKQNKLSVLKAICIISNLPLYSTHKDILNNIFSIASNYKINKTLFPDQLKYVYLKEKSKSYTVLKEFSILEFYFSFLLNCLKFSNKDAGIYVSYIGNNAGKKCFTKLYLNDKVGYPLVDFDMTLLLDRFNVDDLIKIYMSLLMEHKVILMFDDYQEINLIIFSLITLLYPLKWNFPVISFVTQTLLETLEAPFGMLIGLPNKFSNFISHKINSGSFSDETIIYNLTNKSFFYQPKKFPELPLKIINELRSNIYLVLSEKLSLTSDLENDDTELFKLFPSLECAKKIDPIIFLNLKLVQVFYNLFLELVKNIESSIYFNKLKSLKNKKEKYQLYDIFDFNKFLKDREFHNDESYSNFLEQFSKTLMFMQFLEKYVKSSDNKPKYKFIRKMIQILNNKENSKLHVRDLHREYVKNKIISFYNVRTILIKFKFISLEEALKAYIDRTGGPSKDMRLEEKGIWLPLQNNKINSFSAILDKFKIGETDDRLKENTYRRLFLELMKFKDYKKCNFIYTNSDEVEEDEQVYTQTVNNYETKMKSFLEEKIYMSNKDYSTNKAFETYHHKASPSLNLNMNKRNTHGAGNNLIQCNNNIENFFYNNINISTDELNRKFSGFNLNTSGNKSIQVNQSNNSIHTINSINSLKSININNSSNLNPSVSPFMRETFTTRNGYINTSTGINTTRKSQIANLKDVKSGDIFVKKPSQAKDFADFVKMTKLKKTKEVKDAKEKLNLTNFQDVFQTETEKKFRFHKILDTNTSINFSAFKKNLETSSQNIRPSNNVNVYKIKNIENLNKLAGDDEPDIFSDDGESGNKK
jgi:hypothetical protein